MTTKSTEELQTQLERLVREHLAAQHKLATTALERAFALVAPTRRTRPSRALAGQRRPGEMAELVERLCKAVRARPGETMATIAEHVGEKSQALSAPMTKLKSTGRVRSAGERNLTRYFPMTAEKPG